MPSLPPQSRTDKLLELDKRYLWHPFTPMKLWLEDRPLVITDAQGMHLIDSDGNRYLDGVSSLWCNVHGHRVAHIDAAIRAQLDRVAHSTLLGLSNEPAILLAQKLMPLAPRGLAKIFYSDSGATATEIAFKLAVQYWHNIGKAQKNQLVGFSEGYHGDTIGAMSVGRMETFHRPYFPLLFKTHFAPPPIDASALSALEQILDRHGRQIAAVCLEPIVQGAGGILVQPPGFLKTVRELCDRYDVLLVADEVAVGFGRTGTLFACEQENVSPDLMCLAKGISGGYLPLAATLASQKIFDAFVAEPSENKTFFHGHTYGGNALACAAGLASLELFHQNHLLDKIAANAQLLGQMLQPLAHLPHVGQVRHKGLMAGVELVAEKSPAKPFDPRRRTGAKVCAAVRKHGVILRPLADVVVIMPPQAMPADDLRTIVRALELEIAAISS